MDEKQIIAHVGMGVEIEYFDTNHMKSTSKFQGVLIAQRSKRNFSTARVDSFGNVQLGIAFIAQHVVSIKPKLFHTYGVINDKVIPYQWTATKNCVHWDSEKPKPIDFVSTSSPKKVDENPHICPVCQSKGFDMSFAFYCTNSQCQNYAKPKSKEE